MSTPSSTDCSLYKPIIGTQYTTIVLISCGRARDRALVHMYDLFPRVMITAPKTEVGYGSSVYFLPHSSGQSVTRPTTENRSALLRLR